MKVIKTSKYSKISQIEDPLQPQEINEIPDAIPFEWLENVRKEAWSRAIEQMNVQRDANKTPVNFAQPCGIVDNGIRICAPIGDAVLAVVPLLEDYQNNDIENAITRVIKMMYSVAQRTTYKKHTDMIQKDINKYYEDGGQNWSGD